MFTSEEEKLYFLKDYPNHENITLQHRNRTRYPRKYSHCSQDSILNSKIIIFNNHKFNYLCLDCDKGISKLNPVIIDFLNQKNIVYFITQGTWTEGKPKDSATLCIQYKNYNSETRTKLNKLFRVVSRLPNGEMTCDPLAIGDQMKSVFTNQMESRYYNMGGNVFDLKELTEIAFCHFNRTWDEVECLANQYYSEAYYQKYKELTQYADDEICVSKLEHYYYNMRKYNDDNWLYDNEIIDAEIALILEKYKALPLKTKIETVSKKTLIKDYVLINWCKHNGYAEHLKFYTDLLEKKFKITSKMMIYKLRDTLGIRELNTSNEYLDFVSLIEDEHLMAIKKKLNESKTKKRKRDKPTKKHKVHKNKGKFTTYLLERNGKTKEVKSTEKSAYIKRGWVIFFSHPLNTITKL